MFAQHVPAEGAVERIIAAIRMVTSRRPAPVLVAVDGPSGSGKSTVARAVAEAMDAAVIPSDDFFAAEITDAEWESRNPAERAAGAIDWRRMRREALDPLRAGLPARWHAFDFTAGALPDGTYAMQRDATELEPKPIVIMEGAYSARPELSDLIDLSVLVDAPAHLRQERLAGRESAEFIEAWHARWDAAEVYYFTHVRPPSSFDIIVSAAPESTSSGEGPAV